MNIDAHVEIPADSLRKAVALAYDYSCPQGLGFLHARDGKLDEETIDGILSRAGHGYVASMDYVHGRACKFHVHEYQGRLFVAPRWFDHSDGQLINLLTELGVDDPAGKIAAARAGQQAANEAWERERATRA